MIKGFHGQAFGRGLRRFKQHQGVIQAINPREKLCKLGLPVAVKWKEERKLFSIPNLSSVTDALIHIVLFETYFPGTL